MGWFSSDNMERQRITFDELIDQRLSQVSDPPKFGERECSDLPNLGLSNDIGNTSSYPSENGRIHSTCRYERNGVQSFIEYRENLPYIESRHRRQSIPRYGCHLCSAAQTTVSSTEVLLDRSLINFFADMSFNRSLCNINIVFNVQIRPITIQHSTS